MKEQAAAFLEHVNETGLGTEIVMHDRDTKFTAAFDYILKSAEFVRGRVKPATVLRVQTGQAFGRNYGNFFPKRPQQRDEGHWEKSCAHLGGWI